MFLDLLRLNDAIVLQFGHLDNCTFFFINNFKFNSLHFYVGFYLLLVFAFWFGIIIIVIVIISVC